MRWPNSKHNSPHWPASAPASSPIRESCWSARSAATAARGSASSTRLHCRRPRRGRRPVDPLQLPAAPPGGHSCQADSPRGRPAPAAAAVTHRYYMATRTAVTCGDLVADIGAGSRVRRIVMLSGIVSGSESRLGPFSTKIAGGRYPPLCCVAAHKAGRTGAVTEAAVASIEGFRAGYVNIAGLPTWRGSRRAHGAHRPVLQLLRAGHPQRPDLRRRRVPGSEVRGEGPAVVLLHGAFSGAAGFPRACA